MLTQNFLSIKYFVVPCGVFIFAALKRVNRGCKFLSSERDVAKTTFSGAIKKALSQLIHKTLITKLLIIYY